MSAALVSALFLALIWGAIWAACLQWTMWGRWMAVRRTWLTVVIGVGADLLIALLVVPFEVWAIMTGIISISSVPIITRSIYQEQREDVE